MRGVEQPDIELVADIGPRHFPHQRDVEPSAAVNPLFDGDNQRRGVGQRK